jgi:uncharacterized protein YoaH (UPF0181 family)
MNVNEAFYDPEKVRGEVERLMAAGLSYTEAISRLVQNVMSTTAAESECGVVHGEVLEIHRG